jgi:Phage integrase family
MKAARNLRSTSTLNPWTYYCLFGLLATTGMRISEALDLQVKDVDWTEGILTIHGKCGKSRLVPLHASTRKILSRYSARRDRFFGRQPVWHFFASSRGTRLDGGHVRRTFYYLSRQTDCVLFRPAMGRGSTIFATDLRSKRYYAGISKVRMSNGACRFCRLILATRMSLTRIGTLRALRN